VRTVLAAAIPAQPEPQTEFLRGAAGGGKIVGWFWSRCATPWLANFIMVFFRRSMPQITNPCGVILRKQLLKGSSRDKREDFGKHGFVAPLLRHERLVWGRYSRSMAVAKMTVGSIVAVCWRYGERRLLAGTEEIDLSGQIVGLLERSQLARAIHKNAAVGKVLPILDVSLSTSILARRTLSKPCSTIVEYLPRVAAQCRNLQAA